MTAKQLRLLKAYCKVLKPGEIAVSTLSGAVYMLITVSFSLRQMTRDMTSRSMTSRDVM